MNGGRIIVFNHPGMKIVKSNQQPTIKGDKNIVYEWKIENLSCWIKEVHGVFINISTSNHTIKLFPKGLEACGEYLVVQITDHRYLWRYSGDLTLINSNGSILFTQQVKLKHAAKTQSLPPGYKFEELLRQIKGSKGFQKDQLTLRFQFMYTFSYVEYMSTTIEVFDASIKISRKIFENLKSGNDCNISLFHYPLDDGVKAEVVLFASEGKFDHLKIMLALKASIHGKNVLIVTRVSVLNNNDVVKTKMNEHVFSKDEDWSFSNSLTREETMKEEFSLNLCFKIIPNNTYKHSLSVLSRHLEKFALLPSNTLGIPSSSANVSEENFSRSLTDVSIQPSNSITVLAKELMSLYQDGTYSDFELTCGNVSYATHKAILSARSPVFKSLLLSNLKEATCGTAVIEDLDSPTLTRFLVFLYTGTVEEQDGESAIKLYYAADKYQVPTLKKECASILCANLSIGNVSDILSLADKTQDHELTAVAHGFILKNYNDVLRSEGWARFMRIEPLLAAETLTHFSTKGKLKALP